MKCEARSYLDQTPCLDQVWATVTQGKPRLRAELCWVHAITVRAGRATLLQVLEGKRANPYDYKQIAECYAGLTAVLPLTKVR